METPELKHEWRKKSGRTKPFASLTIGLCVPGYWSIYNAMPWPDTVGHLEATSIDMGQPEGYLAVSTVKVDSKWRRQGLGKLMYREATRLAREAGYLGIASDTTGRSNDAARVWGKLGSKRVGEYDVLESQCVDALVKTLLG